MMSGLGHLDQDVLIVQPDVIFLCQLFPVFIGSDPFGFGFGAHLFGDGESAVCIGVHLPDDDLRAVIAVAFALNEIDQDLRHAFPGAFADDRSADAAFFHIAGQQDNHTA